MKISSFGGSGVSYTGETQKKGTTTYTYQNQIRSIQTNKEKTKKKKLNYRYKEISSAIRQSKKSSNATLVLTKAKSVLSNLLKSQGTGKYDKSELSEAISHAKKMIRCAKMKVGHLKQEENQRNSNTQDNQMDKKQGNAAKSQKRMRQELAKEEIILQQKIKSRERQVNQSSNDHRNKEQKKLDEADLEYLKRKMERLAANTGTDETVFQMSSEYDMVADMEGLLVEPEATAEMTVEAAAEGIDVSL